MLDRVVCSTEQFNFQMCLKSGDGSQTFRSWRQRLPDSRCYDAECLGLKVDPCRRPADRVVGDWRISEYELVGNNESSHIDKPVVLFSEFYVMPRAT